MVGFAAGIGRARVDVRQRRLRL